jgi:hypothetical protein
MKKPATDPKVKYELFMLACQQISDHQPASAIETIDKIRYIIDPENGDQAIVEALVSTAASVPGMGMDQVVKWLSREMGATFKFKSYQPIRMACINGQMELARWMIDQTGDDIRVVLGDLAQKKTLTWVVYGGQLKTARWLVSAGYEHGAEAPSALYMALKAGHLGVVEYLVNDLGYDLAVLPADKLLPLLNDLGNQAMLNKGYASLLAAELEDSK